MKRILIFVLILLLSAGPALAQRGLNCYPIFRGKVVPQKAMVVTEVRGDGLATYKLSHYRGLRFQVDSLTAAKAAALVEADALAAESAETEKSGSMLTYALAQLKPSGKTRRYLCYQAKDNGFGGWIVTILYLEGSATLEDLRSMFDKQ